MNSFYETVSFIPRQAEKFKGNLYIAAYLISSSHSILTGLVIVNNEKCDETQIFMSDVLKILKSENIVLTESLGEKLTDIFKQHIVNLKTRGNDFFSCRENQVLRLSMEGLPIKIIADKLSISNRTVEKNCAQLMEKTNSNNMIEVIVFALRNNLIDF